MLQDPTLLEFAWIELLDSNKSVTVEELAEVCVLEGDIGYFIVSPLTFLHSYRWYLAVRNPLRAIARIFCYPEMKSTSLCLIAKALPLFMVLGQLFRCAFSLITIVCNLLVIVSLPLCVLLVITRGKHLRKEEVDEYAVIFLLAKPHHF